MSWNTKGFSWSTNPSWIIIIISCVQIPLYCCHCKIGSRRRGVTWPLPLFQASSTSTPTPTPTFHPLWFGAQGSCPSSSQYNSDADKFVFVACKKTDSNHSLWPHIVRSLASKALKFHVHTIFLIRSLYKLFQFRKFHNKAGESFPKYNKGALTKKRLEREEKRGFALLAHLKRTNKFR